ncbi:hypothetical protein PF003_g3340 [Phytophthora fragariae]|nr:hypothetical protein PF003_g3340 [Phytophthora fragariae]
MASPTESLADRMAAASIRSRGGSPASPPMRMPGLRLQIPNPFEALETPGEEETEAVQDAEMATASPEAFEMQRVAAAPALPQPPRFSGRTMEDRREFMLKYETYLSAINALQTSGQGAFAMPVGACVDSLTKRRVARYELNCLPSEITEQQWINYFKEANMPTYVDYAVVDEAMKKLKIQTKWPDPESRMAHLEADLEAILQKFNLTDVAFKNEQRRIVGYLAHALEPAGFRSAIAIQLSLNENKLYKREVVPFCSWVTAKMREFMTWERAVAASIDTPRRDESSSIGNGGRGGGHRGRSRGGGSDGASSSGGPRVGSGGRGGPRQPCRGTSANTGGSLPPAPDAASSGSQRLPGACLKCGALDHQVRDCRRAEPGEASRLLRELRQQRQAVQPTATSMRRVEVVGPNGQAGCHSDETGTVDAVVEGLALKALLMDSGADTSLVARGVIDKLEQSGTAVNIVDVAPRELTPIGGRRFFVTRVATFREVVLTTSAGPLMLRNLACNIEEANTTLDFNVGRPII